MVKRSLKSIHKTHGGKQVRIGVVFHEALKKIRKKILINLDLDEISFEEITNILTRHKLWSSIIEDTENVKEEEILKYGTYKK